MDKLYTPQPGKRLLALSKSQASLLYGCRGSVSLSIVSTTTLPEIPKEQVLGKSLPLRIIQLPFIAKPVILDSMPAGLNLLECTSHPL